MEKLIPINFGINNNEYFNTNVIKYLNTEQIPDNYLINTKDLNKILYKLTEDKIICITEDEKNFINSEIKMPVYPIILFNTKQIILTSVILKQIYGIPIENNFKDIIKYIISNIKKTVGLILIDNIELYNEIEIITETYNGYFSYMSKMENNTGAIKISKNIAENFTECSHGWLASGTKAHLEYCIKTYNPKNILELGTWYGKSTCFMRDITPTSNFYCFDKFQNIVLSPYPIVKFNPIDKFYFTRLRFETFSKNILQIDKKHKGEKLGDIFIFKHDAYKSIKMMAENKVEIDMIFIDFIKSASKLIKFLEECITYFPNAIIVGDDYIFDTVKSGILHFITKHKINIGILSSSYILSKDKLINYNNVELNKKTTIKENPYTNTLKLIQNNLYTNTQEHIQNNKLSDELIVLNKENHLCKEILNYMKENKIDLNKNVLDKQNTLYNEIAKIQYMTKLDLMSIFEEYQKPEKVENILLLTYEDYLNYNLSFDR